MPESFQKETETHILHSEYKCVCLRSEPQSCYTGRETRALNMKNYERVKSLFFFPIDVEKISTWSHLGRISEIRCCNENGRKAAHSNTRSFKPQKLFRATNSFYKAACALIPVISKSEGRRRAVKSTCLWKWRCFFLPDVFSLNIHKNQHWTKLKCWL